MISFTHKGSLKKTSEFLNAISGGKYLRGILEECGREGVDALRSATPKDTGKTADSWVYEIVRENDGNISVVWSNTNTEKGYFNVALMLQLGHGTKNGGYVQGIDYINPALQPIFDKIADKAWKAVTKS